MKLRYRVELVNVYEVEADNADDAVFEAAAMQHRGEDASSSETNVELTDSLDHACHVCGYAMTKAEFERLTNCPDCDAHLKGSEQPGDDDE